MIRPELTALVGDTGDSDTVTRVRYEMVEDYSVHNADAEEGLLKVTLTAPDGTDGTFCWYCHRMAWAASNTIPCPTQDDTGGQP